MDIVSNVLVPFTVSNPAISCESIVRNNLSRGSDLYWIDPQKIGAFQVYCDMDYDGGGWMLVAKFNSLATVNMFTSSELSTSHGDINNPYASKYMLRTSHQFFKERNAKVNGVFMNKVSENLAVQIFGLAKSIHLAHFSGSHYLSIGTHNNEFWSGYSIAYPYGPYIDLSANTQFYPFNKTVPNVANVDYCSFSGGGVSGYCMKTGFGCRSGSNTWAAYTSSEYVEIYGR